jgi:hypothetical protein
MPGIEFGNGERFNSVIDKMPRCYDTDEVQVVVRSNLAAATG